VVVITRTSFCDDTALETDDLLLAANQPVQARVRDFGAPPPGPKTDPDTYARARRDISRRARVRRTLPD
jgi:hypothetical protein